MRIRPLLGILGVLLVSVGIAMLTAVPVSLSFRGSDTQALLVSSLITIGAGLFLMQFIRSLRDEELRAREGFAIVSFGWIIAPVFGSLPFLLSGYIPNFTDAYFETVSGFTTTGASILRNVEGLPHGLLYWRALTQWLGGMGIIVLSLAILPLLGVGGMQLFKAEFAGPTKDKLTPRMAETARLLWGVYVLMTAAETVLLMAGGMSLFDAVCHSFTTIATGGFSTKNASIAHYDSAYIDGVITFFMFAAAVRFPLHYAALRGKFSVYRQDDEFIFYTISFAAGVAIVGAVLIQQFDMELLQSLRYASFNVISIMSSTGFATADFVLWAPLGQIVLLFLMFPGACAGSTGGGMKNLRVLLLLKTAVNEFQKLIHPKAIVPVRYNGKVVEQEILFTIAGFIILFLVTFSVGAMVLTATGIDLVTSFSAVASAMSNVGPGFGTVGPMANYAHFSDIAKWVLGMSMVLGRLEIYTVFVLFSKAFWRS